MSYYMYLTILAASSRSSQGKIRSPLFAINALASSTFVPIKAKGIFMNKQKGYYE